MTRLVEHYEYKGVEFEIMADEDEFDNNTVYYYWDLVGAIGAGSCSFLPWDTVEEVKEDARREVDGENVVTEAQIQEQVEILQRKMRPN